MTTPMNTKRHNNNDEIDLFELAQELWRQKWLIVGITFLLTILAVTYALLATPVYQATARVVPPNAGDVEAFNLGKSQAGLTKLDVDSAYSFFRRDLTSQATRRWFLEEYYRPYLSQHGFVPTLNTLTLKLAAVLVVSKPDERNNPDVYEISVKIDDPKLAAEWANAYVQRSAIRARRNLENRTTIEIDNRRTELQRRIDVLRSSTLNQRKDRIARLKEALKIAKAVGFDAPQVTRGQTAAESDLAQVIDGNLLYMRGSRAIQAELELLEDRKNDDPFIIELRDLEQQMSLLNLIEPVPETVQLYSLDNAADVPDGPIEPKKTVIVASGVILGAMLGGMAALVRIAVRRRRRALVAPSTHH